MTATDYSNQRRHKRVYLGTEVPVFDIIRGKHIGEVVNITVEGLMLVLDEEVTPGNIYQFALSMPESVEDHKVINLGALALWSSPASIAGHYWAGFQIIDASDLAEQLIVHLIDKYGTD